MIFCPMTATGWTIRRSNCPAIAGSGREDALAREPVLAGDGFEGAFEYHDAQMYAPERIALECLVDADAHGAAIANYLAAEKLLLRGRQGRRLPACATP